MNARSRLSLALSALYLGALPSCGGKHGSLIDDVDSGTAVDAAMYQPDALTSSCFGSGFRCEGRMAIPCEISANLKPIDCAETEVSSAIRYAAVRAAFPTRRRARTAWQQQRE